MLQEKLQEIKQAVDCYLKEFFAEKKTGIGAVHPEVEKLIADIEDVTLRGGDRFRPFMVWLGAKSALKEFTNLRIYEFKNNKGKKKNELIKLMCSVELLHSFALIHDDIIDKAETRRGGPTIKPDEKAILAGDLCFIFADELLNGMNEEVKKQFDVLREEVIAGEWLDVFTSSKFKIQNSKLQLKIQNDVLMKIYEYKTARYTFLRPFMMGYQFAARLDSARQVRKNPSIKKQKMIDLKTISRVLINIGISFQMKDDYLDLFGDARLGKKIGGDLREGKLTIWHAKIMEKMKELEQSGNSRKYGEIWGKSNITQEDVEWVKKLIEKTGVRKEVEEEMREIVKRGIGEIGGIRKITEESRKLLIEMAEFVVGREY